MKPLSMQISLKIYPDDVLRRICEPVEKFDSGLRDLKEEMVTIMRICSGIGLAAPQVGITKRLFICEIETRSLCLVNPTIKSTVGTNGMIEGCLSLPDVQVNVPRSSRLSVEGYDSKGRKKHFEFKDLWARVVQHEIDHLDGVLICDHGKNLRA